MRYSRIERKTKETDITLTLNIDGTGKSDIDSGCPFLDHMLTLFSSHSRMDLTVRCKGDTEVDYHHTVEDIGIALGQALKEALGDRKGIIRYGNMTLPMDEALIMTAVDISGRGYASLVLELPTEKVGDFDTELCLEFWIALAREAAITVHAYQLAGLNSHHIIEGVFKSFARSIRQAVSIDEKYPDEIPSTKGTL